MTFTFLPAKRERVSMFVALAGASGSGKTMSALRLAQGMAPAGKIAFIDTEARRGLHYADQFKFLHCDMRPPFRPMRFLEAVRAAEQADAEVIVFDNFSDEYEGEGGIVDWADEIAEGKPKPGIENPRNPNEGDGWKDWLVKPVPSPGNWKDPKGSHKKMMNSLLQCRSSMIFCLRADEKIAIEKKEVEQQGGKKKSKTFVTPLGWMPICEKRFMYMMTASFTLTPDRPGIPHFDLPHKCQPQHRSFFPEGKLINEASGRALAKWARGDDSDDAGALLVAGDEASERGVAVLDQWWRSLTKDQQNAIGRERSVAWARRAKQADKAFGAAAQGEAA